MTQALLWNALVWGLVLSAALFALFLVVLRWNPEIMLKDYPPDIQAKHGAMSERGKRQKLVASIAFVAVLVAIVAASFQKVRAFDGGDLRFATSFLHAGVMFLLFNLLDWLVLDVPLVALKPRFIVLPGTEGMAGYGNYWFHFRGFLIGIVASLVGALLTAAIAAPFF
jgi:hypothetical protein